MYLIGNVNYNFDPNEVDSFNPIGNNPTEKFGEKAVHTINNLFKNIKIGNTQVLNLKETFCIMELWCCLFNSPLTFAKIIGMEFDVEKIENTNDIIKLFISHPQFNKIFEYAILEIYKDLYEKSSID